MQLLSSLSEISDSYDAFILDLWGMIFDGDTLYPGALDALKELNNQGKQVVFLTNAPRRAVMVEEKITPIGVTENLYKTIISSGEATIAHVQAHPEIYGSTYAFIGPERDRNLFGNSSEYKEVPINKNPSFVVAIGFDDNPLKRDENWEDVFTCLQLDIPMICANPDRVVVKQTPTPYGEIELPCAGQMADYYAEHDGRVEYIGKPHSLVYKLALEQFENVDKNRILVAGDSLHHDVLGGINSGLDSLLVTGGILSRKHSEAELADKTKLTNIFQEIGIEPTYAMKNFRF